ncbi:MAG: DoxX family protein [Pyrinomonadaceae bacterium]
MERVLGRYSGHVYALLRIVAGFLFLLHGTQKLFNLPPGQGGGEVSGLPLIAGVIELVGGLMIMLGLFASIAAFIASGTMAVAYFMVHQPMGALPIQNRGELAALYSFVFLYIAARGSGPWSIDALIRGRSTLDGAE